MPGRCIKLIVVNFQNFGVVVSSLHEWITKLNIGIKPIEPTLEAGAQVQQLINVECIEDYKGTRLLLLLSKITGFFIIFFR